MPPPEKGTPRWKDQAALDWAFSLRLFDTQGVYKVPSVLDEEIGFFVIRKPGGNGPYNSTDYFRVDCIITPPSPQPVKE